METQSVTGIKDSRIQREKTKLDDVADLFFSLKTLMQQMITEERRAGKHLAAICEKVKQDLDRSLSNCQDNTVARTIFEELTELSRNLKESHMRSHNRLFTVHSEISEFRESDLQFMVRPSNNREYTLMMSPTKKTVGVSRLFSIFGGSGSRIQKKSITKMSKDDEDLIGEEQMTQLLEILHSRKHKREVLMVHSLESYFGEKKSSCQRQIELYDNLLENLRSVEKLRKNIPIANLTIHIRDCYAAVLRLGGANEVGVFRRSPSSEAASLAVQNFVNAGKVVFSDGDDPLTPAWLLKHIMRNSVAPLIPLALMDELKNQPPCEESYRDAARQIPAESLDALRVVSELLCDFEQYEGATKMTMRALLIVFQPCLYGMRTSDSVEQMKEMMAASLPFTEYLVRKLAKREDE